MAINPDLLIAAPMLQDYLVDKSTGLPLVSGIVSCYQDNSRTTFKNWYYQSGGPGAYTYVPLNNPLTLSAVGTITDPSGNDTIPFFYPYDEDNSSIAQPYYITVYSSSSVLQFTRQNFPFVTGNTEPVTDQQLEFNLIPNGQFLAHNDLPNSGVVQNGVQQITTATFGTSVLGNNTSAIIAQGASVGWYFIKDHGSNSTDVITFQSYSTENSDVLGNPSYLLNIQCNNAGSGGDTFKELRIRFNNVNHFSSNAPAPNGFYTIGFQGSNINAGTQSITLYRINYFGSGGSSPTQTPVSNFTLEHATFDYNSTPIQFPLNSSKVISGGDDYIELSISLPINLIYNVTLSGFVMVPGDITITSYPEVPDNNVYSEVVGSQPNNASDGSDLYLPLVKTPGGAIWYTGDIGKIYSTAYALANTSELLCNGTGYVTSSYSTAGIPYSRLQKVLFNNNNSFNIPIFGTGKNYFTAYQGINNTHELRLYTNKPGNQTLATDSGPDTMTGFTFAQIHTGQTTNMSAYTFVDGGNGARNVLVIDNLAGGVANSKRAQDGNTTMIITPLRNSTGGPAGAPNAGGSSVTFQSFAICAKAASSLTNTGSTGHYFTFTSATGATDYYVWFKISNETDPAPGGTGIQVNLLSGYTAVEVASCIAGAISGYTQSSIICNAGSTLTTGDYFTFAANSINYNVWYNIASAGGTPNNGNTNIEVDLAGTETNVQVAVATQKAINSYSFAVPNIVQGMFLRAIDANGTWDLQNYARWSGVDTIVGANIGTMELDDIFQHYHYGYINTTLAGAVNTSVSQGGGGGTPGTYNYDTGRVSLTGQNTNFGINSAAEVAYPDATLATLIPPASQTESRPVNMYVNYVIKY